MKLSRFILFVLIFVFLFSFPIKAQYTVCSSYKVGNLEFISYSEKWNEESLKALYIELLSNFHGDEFGYLSKIYLYPDSPYGVNGYYYDDIYIENGVYKCGNKAYIELYDMNENDTIKKVSRTLAHEYGHHYTIYNMVLKEGLYYTQWIKSEYVKVRGLIEYPVSYNYNSAGNTYRWDVAEIMAEDYVQLLGSSIAKMSTDYMDCVEMLENNVSQGYSATNSFNLMPQKNPYIPLAADIDGLYEYMSALAGYKTATPKKSNTSEILSVEMTLNELGKKEYEIKWSEATENEPYEYTLVMYPVSNPLVPVPLKTVNSGEELSAKIGSVALKDENGEIKTMENNYEGDYEFIVYYKDKDGFIHRSKPFDFSFGYEEFVKDNSQGDTSKYTSEQEREFSTITIDEDYDEEQYFEEFYGDFYADFSNKLSFKAYYYDIIKWMNSVFN